MPTWFFQGECNVEKYRFTNQIKTESILNGGVPVSIAKCPEMIELWVDHYNQNPPHLSFNGLTPDAVYYSWAKNTVRSAVEKDLASFPQLNNSEHADYPARLPELCSQNS